MFKNFSLQKRSLKDRVTHHHHRDECTQLLGTHWSSDSPRGENTMIFHFIAFKTAFIWGFKKGRNIYFFQKKPSSQKCVSPDILCGVVHYGKFPHRPVHNLVENKIFF
jgi:hypothetical protein